MTARTCGPGSLRGVERVFWRVVEGGRVGVDDDVSESWGPSSSSCWSSRGTPVGLLGVWRVACRRTAVIVGFLPELGFAVSPSSDGFSSRSLFTQRVQANVSPTYAAPKEAGRVRSGVRGDDEVDGQYVLSVVVEG